MIYKCLHCRYAKCSQNISKAIEDMATLFPQVSCPPPPLPPLPILPPPQLLGTH